MKAYEAVVAVPTVINFLSDLGTPAKRGSSIANPGEADFRIRLTLGNETRAPLTIPAGVRWLLMSNVDRVEILPGLDGDAWYQLLVTS
ncbi:hypothetical protein [Deinococcus sp. QL22]|uniref:hypothetical protein n=1 Tax=Deinococcus sp. QL22 TaxID=2939437 RepID=UPI0020173B1F|nr:hypothetical protein [Deinococcus sp. QL22]UQN06756.1 hypothetical protein M1R55_02205 [Deinococcus sp. QL22]